VGYALVAALVSTLIGGVVLPIASPGRPTPSSPDDPDPTHTSGTERPLGIELTITEGALVGRRTVVVRGTMRCARASSASVDAELSQDEGRTPANADVTSPDFESCTTTPTAWIATGRTFTRRLAAKPTTVTAHAVTCDDVGCEQTTTTRTLTLDRR
jgi:hypothetical protein